MLPANAAPNVFVEYCVPFDMRGIPVTAHFVNRKDETKQLETFFRRTTEASRRKIFIVHGMGGVGKTQLCIKYVRREKSTFNAIFWLDGSSRDAVRQSLAAATLRLPGEGAKRVIR